MNFIISNPKFNEEKLYVGMPVIVEKIGSFSNSEKDRKLGESRKAVGTIEEVMPKNIIIRLYKDDKPKKESFHIEEFVRKNYKMIEMVEKEGDN